MQTLRFDDFDEFADSVDGVDSKMLMRNPDNRSWTIDRVDLEGVEVQIGRLGSGNIACGEIRPDVRMLYLPLTNGIEYHGNGAAIQQNSLFMLEPSAEFYINTKVRHDWFALLVPLNLMPIEAVDAFRKSCHVLVPDRRLIDRLRLVASEILAASDVCPSFELTQAGTNAKEYLAGLMALLTDQPSVSDAHSDGRPKIIRETIVRRSLDHLDQHQGENVSVNKLASVCAVSDRTLRTTFHEYFGVGPAEYMRLRQLHIVRTALKASDPEATTVAQVLAGNGIWAFGRFAVRYRKQFGESPSATLRSGTFRRA